MFSDFHPVARVGFVIVVVSSVCRDSDGLQAVEVGSRRGARDSVLSSGLCKGLYCDACCPVRLMCDDLALPGVGMGGGHEQTSASEIPLRCIPQEPELTGCSGCNIRRSGTEDGATRVWV